MKELRKEVMQWLEKRYGKSLYDDLCFKKSISEIADYFLENHIIEEIEAMGGLDVCLESWTEEFVPSEVMEAENTKEEIKMMQENACAANEGRPLPYSEEDFDEVFRKYHLNKGYRLSVQLSKKYYDYVKKVAEQNGESLSGAIRRMIIRDMNK